MLEGQQARLRHCAPARQGARRVRLRPSQSPPFRPGRRRALHLRLTARRALHVRHREPGELRAAASRTQRPVRARRPRHQLQRERQALAGHALRAQHARGAARRADVARERHLGGVLERGALQRQRDGHGARDEQGARAAAAGARRPRRARARRQRQRPQALGEAGQAAQQRRVRGHGQAHQPHVACARGRAASHAAHPGSAAPHRTAAPGSARQCGAADRGRLAQRGGTRPRRASCACGGQVGRAGGSAAGAGLPAGCPLRRRVGASHSFGLRARSQAHRPPCSRSAEQNRPAPCPARRRRTSQRGRRGARMPGCAVTRGRGRHGDLQATGGHNPDRVAARLGARRGRVRRRRAHLDQLYGQCLRARQRLLMNGRYRVRHDKPPVACGCVSRPWPGAGRHKSRASACNVAHRSPSSARRHHALAQFQESSAPAAPGAGTAVRPEVALLGMLKHARSTPRGRPPSTKHAVRI